MIDFLLFLLGVIEGPAPEPQPPGPRTPELPPVP